MTTDPKKLVQDGYDVVAGEYAGWAVRIENPARRRWVDFLLENLPEDAPLLDLGCGNGLSSTRELAGRFTVTGVDVSARQLEYARRNVPRATFLQTEMSQLDFPPGSFAAVTAFFSIIHLPRDEQPGMFRSIQDWLLPGGYLVVVMGAADSPGDIDPDWLGAPMYWSHFDSATNVAMVETAGFEIISAQEETISEDGVPVTFLWVIARNPNNQTFTET
jgi:SAM-dependent methyltransferase